MPLEHVAPLPITQNAIAYMRAMLRRLYTHVDFVAKRHDSWRFQHPFFAPKKSISFFRPTPRGFYCGIQQPRLFLLPEVYVYTPYSGLKIVSFKIFGHCSAQKFEMAFFSGFSSTPL